MGWTRNYYNLLTAFLLGDTTETSVNVPVDYQPPIVFRKVNGTYSSEVRGFYPSYPCRPEDPSSGSSYFKNEIGRLFSIGKTPVQLVLDAGNESDETGIQFGSGVTAPDYEDYRLDTPITAGLSMVNSSGTLTAPSAFDAVTHKYSSTRTFTINNTSANSITLKEMGIFVLSVLVYREVLGSAITIDPGESITVSFTREATVFNYTPYT